MLKRDVLLVPALIVGMMSASAVPAFSAEDSKSPTQTQESAADAKQVTVPTKEEAADEKKSKSDPKAEKASKAHLEHAVKKQVQTDEAMIRDVNKLDGVNVDKDAFKPEKKGFKVGDLNPMKWVFKPITDMQKQVVHLEKQIMRLEAPIASLQKPMMGLREDMVHVQTQMGELRGDMTGVHSQMGSVDKRLGHVERQLSDMYGPIVELKDPVVELKKPVVGVNAELLTLKRDLKELKDVVSLTTTLILVAVIGVGLFVVVGTPIAAMFAWRHRTAIMSKLGGDDKNTVDPLNESPRKTETVSSRR